MSIPQHTVHIYQRPAQGNNFIRRYPVFNYKHTIAAQGGFDTASCDIMARSLDEGLKILDDYLGARVAVIIDNPCEPAWEGLINRMTFNSGGISYSVSLDEMANRLSVVYSAATNVGTETTIANSTTSQAIYGVKQDQIELGANNSGTTSHPNALRDTQLAQRAFPQTSITQGGGNTNLITLECIGFFHTLEWEKIFTGVLAGSASYDNRITAWLGALANGTTFFNNADLTKITANAKTISTQQRAQTYWELFLKVAESGDASNYWVVSITPTDWNTKTRVMQYQPQNAAVTYLARARDGLRLRNLQGKFVLPWTVRPDCGVMVTDVHVDYNANVTTDPRVTYMFNIAYDANTQTVQYFGADDTSARGAFMLRRGFKPFGRGFPGAQLRVITT